jgi:hypothetical protein
MVTRTVIIETKEQELAFNTFIKSNHIVVKTTVTPADLALGIAPGMSEEDWDNYFKQHPISKTGKPINNILNGLT